MAALRNKLALNKLLEYAKEIGLNYTPLSIEEIEKFSLGYYLLDEVDPYDELEFTSDVIVEDISGDVSGYYGKYSNGRGWALIAIGPKLNKEFIELADWLRIPKAEGWATRSNMNKDSEVEKVEEEDIVFNVDDKGVVRLGKVLSLTNEGTASEVLFKGQKIPVLPDTPWLKATGREEAARWMFDNGKPLNHENKWVFINKWTFITQLGKRQALLDKEKIRSNNKKDNKNVGDLYGDEEFLTKIKNKAEEQLTRKERQ